MKLIGSVTSPYVRRIRLLLVGTDYEFETLDVFSGQGQSALEKLTPTRRVPVLVDGDTVVWDSYLATKYILQSRGEACPGLETEKKLVLINEANDSAINLFQLKKFELDPDWSSRFSKIQCARIEQILSYFDARTDLTWELSGTWLYCFLDWLSFRKVLPWEEKYESLRAFHASHQDRAEVVETDPRPKVQ